MHRTKISGAVVDDVNSRTTFQRRPTCTRREKNLSLSKRIKKKERENIIFIAARRLEDREKLVVSQRPRCEEMKSAMERSKGIRS